MSQSSSAERGAIIIFGPFVLAIVLLFSAVAVDGVRLYHARFSLQKLADMAAIGVVGYTVQDGMLRVLDRFDVEEAVEMEDEDLTTLAREIVEVNASYLQWAPAELTVSAEQIPPRTADQVFGIRVSVERDVPLLLINRMPFFLFETSSPGDQRRLSAVAESGRKRANVSLLLDVSRSMQCPSFEPCTCLSSRRNPNEDCPSPHKIDTLEEATKEFAKRFDIATDRLHFVPFQLLSLTYSVRELLLIAGATGAWNGPTNPSEIGNAIPEAVDAMLRALVTRHPPEGNTNFSDALYEAYRRMASEIPNPLESAAYVLVTDGAPTAATLDFANPRSLGQSPPGSGNRRYVSWTNDFFNSEGRVSVPAALASRDSFVNLPGDGMGYRDAHPPSIDPLRCPAQSPVPRNPTEAEVQNAANQAFACVADLGFNLNKPNGDKIRDPNNNPILFGSGPGSGNPGLINWKQQYFNATIAQADSMRGIIYVIGIGEPAPIGTDCYQNADDSQSRHDVFLARLANDYYLGKQLNNHPECDFTGALSYDSWRGATNRKEGRYFPISPSENLRTRMQEIYRQIAIQIQLSLIR